MCLDLEGIVSKACADNKCDGKRLMNIARAVQRQLGCVPQEAIDLIARQTNTQPVEVRSLVSFYAFLSTEPKAPIVIRLCDDVIDEMKGAVKVANALEDELGIAFGETTPDGAITLEHTPCIGMSDQAPAMLVNDTVLTRLNCGAAREVVQRLRDGATPAELVTSLGDGNNADDRVQAMIDNNIRERGPVLFADYEDGAGMLKALAMTPAEVVRAVKTSRLRGRGGAGFPTGLKWDFARQALGDQRYVLCNADEGEPGTFKDRVVLTERADLMFEGMTIAGYAIGANEGVLYLRAEYIYLLDYLEAALARRRDNGQLGEQVLGKSDFSFDIRIQLGAGAYICGEETALISSCEGQRGDPKTRPPFPAQKGYLQSPTIVNNVETFCCVTRILDEGPGWFAQMGSQGSPGTKLLSISGDCTRPGVYEVPFGISIQDMLAKAGATATAAVQVGGPSGRMVSKAEFDRTICYDDVATGGSVMVFNTSRDLLHVASRFMDFFIEESCGYCTPCRVGNTLIKESLDNVRGGKAEARDLEELAEMCRTVKLMSRCGFGQTCPNPVLSTLDSFPDLYNGLLCTTADGANPTFDIHAALQQATSIAGRESVIY